MVSASELEVVEHVVSSPARGKDDKENYWIQLQIWGEMKNKSNRTVYAIKGDVTYYDAAGKLIDIDSIATETKKDYGDKIPGDPVISEVHFIPPGGSVPFHYTRNLAAIKGVAASHKITLRPAEAVPSPPVGVTVGLKESVGEMRNPALPKSTTTNRMRAFEGEIRNDGKLGCRDPKIVIALLSPDGKVKEVDAFDAKTEDNHKLVLAQGQSTHVKGAVYVTGEDAWREKAQVKTYVDCDEPR